MTALARKILVGAMHETKRAELPLASANAAGVIEGYASLFGAIDSGGDMVLAGAFKRSLLKRGAAAVKMLWQHQAAEPIGVWTSIVEDARGLRVSGRLDLSVARAREALSLMRGGAIDGLSIGFRTMRATTEKSSGVRLLHEVDLWEISIVTFPMLAQARVSKVKRAPVRIDALIAQLARLKQHRAAERFEAKLLNFSLERRYAPDQPRAPAGSPDGGQWTSGESISGGASRERVHRREPDAPTHTALNANPRVASDVDASIMLAQARSGGGRGRGGGFSGPGGPTSSQLDRLESNARLAREAEIRVHEIDPLWKPEPTLIDPNNIEARVARYESMTRQANDRYSDFLREQYGDIKLPGRRDTAPSVNLTGPRAPVRRQDDAETRRGAELENHSADIAWFNGNDVEQKPNVPGPKRPDYRINGELFDNIAPKTNNVRNLWSNVRTKITDRQADNVIINIRDSTLAVAEIEAQFRNYPINGLNRLWIIDQRGQLIYLIGGR